MSADFLDSNVLIYALDSAFPEKQTTVQALLNTALNERSGLISFQVVQDTLNTISRKFKTRVTPDDTAALLESILLPLLRVLLSPALHRDALRVAQRYQLGFYDSLIVASTLSARCDRLFCEDLQHGQNVEGLRIVNPFV